MTTLVLALVMLAVLPVAAGESETCFFDREARSGRNKICYYDCLSGKAAITIDTLKFCPLSIRR